VARSQSEPGTGRETRFAATGKAAGRVMAQFGMARNSSDEAIHPVSSWIATSGCAGREMTRQTERLPKGAVHDAGRRNQL
jgi:hypothetical protein